MKWNKIKRAGALLLAAALLTAVTPILPKISAPVYGAEPSATKFADREELLEKSDLDGTTEDKLVRKVYFGQNGSGGDQAWYIAGQDPVNGGLVLIAASPLGSDVIFSVNGAGEWGAKSYEGDWNCVYPSEAPDAVWSNHYGGSVLREKLKALETNADYFSTAEQNLMKNTTVVTDDTKNDTTYATTDKLYAGYGDFELGDDNYITVGTNSAENLNGGLRIELKSGGPYTEGASFWLRAPYKYGTYGALKADPKIAVNVYTITYDCAIVPVFSLDMAQVLFAAAAPAAAEALTASEGSFALKDALTFRFQDASLKQAAKQEPANINLQPSRIQVTGAQTTDDSYLVVQNDSGAWAKKVEAEEFSLLPGQVSLNGKTLASFDGCTAWLETTDSTTGMPIGDAVVTLPPAPPAQPAPAPAPPLYSLAVRSGSGSGYYTYGCKVNITADPAPEGMRFKEWTTTAGAIEDPKAETTTFTIPIGGAEVTAVYERELQLAMPTVKASATYNSVRLTWKAVKDAEGYQIYRASSKDGVYKKIAATGKTAFTDKRLSTGKAYYYKVCAYGTVDEVIQCGEFSKAVKGVPKTKAPSFSLQGGNNSIKISWKGVSGATGYRIYRASSKKGTFKLVKVTGGKVRSYTSHKLKSRRTYYYKMRSYRVVDGKRIYSNYSIAKSKRTG